MTVFKCNGRSVDVAAHPDELLADVLRDQLGLTGTKVGCGTGDCGACTVILDGAAVCSCLVMIGRCEDRDVRTIEWVVDTELGRLLVSEFMRANAVQCGICSPGLVVAAASLISDSDGPIDRATVAEALAGNLCRCTGYRPIVDAVVVASRSWQACAGGAP